MEIQQHDGVVVEAAGFQQGFAKRYWRRKRCHGREREAPGLRFGCPPFPPLYIGPRERGGCSLGPSSKEGCGQGRSPSSPRHLGGAFPLEDSPLFPISWRMGL